MSATREVTRRDFVRVTAAAGVGLTLAFYLPGCSPGDKARNTATGGDEFVPNAFLRIGPDGSVTVISKHLEMGQGTYTGLATLVAEELDADWRAVKVEGAPADAKRYNNLQWGDAQGTGGSSAIANSYEQHRKAGATARAMLVAAAAAEWSVPASEITVENGIVRHAGSGKESGFGGLVARAATMSPPAEVTLKDPATLRYFRLQPIEHFLVTQFDGKKTARDLLGLALRALGGLCRLLLGFALLLLGNALGLHLLVIDHLADALLDLAADLLGDTFCTLALVAHTNLLGRCAQEQQARGQSDALRCSPTRRIRGREIRHARHTT